MAVLSIAVGAGLACLAAMTAGDLVYPSVPLSRGVRFTTGAVLVSLAVFVLLACHLGYWPVYAAGAAGLAVARRGAAVRRLPRMPWGFSVFFGAVACLYFVYALAPEIQADAAGYHLRLVSDYSRLHGLGARDGFYDVLPQGMEMLFVPAYAFGGGSAAKLVHFAFLLLTVPLIRELALEAGVSSAGGCAAAGMFLLAPVCAVAGTSAYTDAGLVCACCAVVLLLVRWDRERAEALLVCAGLNAGFCYAVKPTFGWVGLAGAVFVALRARRFRGAAVFAGVALAVALPWLVRAYVLAGSPVAPFLSGWMANRVLTPEMERHLAGQYSAWRAGFEWSRAWWSYAWAGGNQGVFGPAFLLLPLGVAGLFRVGRRWVLPCCLLLAVPFAFNTGARFLMPAMAVGVVGIAAALPRRAVWPVVALQALGVLFVRSDWQLGRVPLAAAFRVEPEVEYLRRSVARYEAAEMVGRVTSGGDRVLACTALPEAYVPREVLMWWHSRRAQEFADALHFAYMSRGTRARLVSLRWNADEYRSVRMTALSELRIVDANLSRGGRGAWEVHRPGETIRFYAPRGARGADLLIWPGDQARANTEVMPASGGWQAPEWEPEARALQIDVRRDAAAFIRRAGYGFIAVPVADDAFAGIGVDLVRHPGDWGVTIAGEADGIYLLRIGDGLF